jgi:hypothetical protein
MDDLSRFFLWRIRCKFHPYIPPDAGLRSYPPHVASLLETLEPLHIIAIGPTWVGVDGAFVDDPRGCHERLELVVETAEAVFGEAEEKAGAGNLEVFRLNTGLTRFHLYWGSVWFVAVCADRVPYPSRFAYVADSFRAYAARKYGDSIPCVVATVDGDKVSFKLSPEFFIDPKPENAKLFGDLLFLAQAGNGWSVEREIDVDCSSDYLVDGIAYIAHVLRDCEGLESFLKHAYEELLVRDPHDGGSADWRAVAKALEKRVVLAH